MPISHEHKCIFIHIPKCAGTSIEKVLGIRTEEKYSTEAMWGLCVHELCDVIGPILKQEHQTVFLYAELQHLTPDQILRGGYVSKDVWENYYKFTFVRNPWDRIVSEYCWRKKLGFKRSFKTLLHWLAKIDMGAELNKLPHIIPQHRFVYDRDGRQVVDFVGKHENLHRDWEHVIKTLNLEDSSLPHLQWTQHKPYIEYYDQSDIDMIAEIYAKDIELFGYKFEGP